MKRRTIVLFLLIAGLARTAAAQELTTQVERVSTMGVGAKFGVVLPEILTRFGPSVGAEVELSYALATANHRLALFGSFAYAQPSFALTNVPDPRVAGGTYDSTTTQREYIASVGVLYRFRPPSEAVKWNGYLGLAARLYFLDTITLGDAGGSQFGQNEETSTQVGGLALGGAEYRLGPGVALLELQFGISSLPHTITGPVSTGALALVCGYRLML